MLRFFTLRRWNTRNLVALLMLAAGAGLSVASAAEVPMNYPMSEVPEPLLARLQRGINLPFWFSYRQAGLDPKIWLPDDADLAALRKIGFTHVRLLLDRAWIADPQHPDHADAARSAELADAVARAAAHDLLVIVALDADSDFKLHLRIGDAHAKQLGALWWNLANQLSKRVPPSLLVFEVLNEPVMTDDAASLKLMADLAGAVRAAAPAYTIAIEPAQYSHVENLAHFAPLKDRNLLYSFHFYEPFNFTHQGATWAGPMWTMLHDLPYPSSPESVAPMVTSLPAQVRPDAVYYGQQHWNRDKLASFITQAADWSRQYGVPIWCGEFGALKTNAPPGARNAWLRDARETLEAQHIGWTHFEYLDKFGIVASGAQGARVYDQAAIAALGLSPP